MQYLTPRKSAEGKGSAHTGTEHHWAMTVTAAGLCILVPVWLYIFGSALGQSREVVLATFANPFAAATRGSDKPAASASSASASSAGPSRDDLQSLKDQLAAMQQKIDQLNR